MYMYILIYKQCICCSLLQAIFKGLIKSHIVVQLEMQSYTLIKLARTCDIDLCGAFSLAGPVLCHTLVHTRLLKGHAAAAQGDSLSHLGSLQLEGLGELHIITVPLACGFWLAHHLASQIQGELLFYTLKGEVI